MEAKPGRMVRGGAVRGCAGIFSVLPRDEEIALPRVFNLFGTSSVAVFRLLIFLPFEVGNGYVG